MGNFTVDIRKKASMVDWTKCIGCEICVQKCPAKAPDSFNVGLEPTKAIYIPFPQAVPKRAAIQVDYCRWFTQGKCRVCEKVCPADAVDYEQKDEIVQKQFGAIVVATGLDVFPWEEYYDEYGSGQIKDVISGLQYERMLNASGPVPAATSIASPDGAAIPRRWSSSSASAPATTRSAGPTARACAACTRPSRRC